MSVRPASLRPLTRRGPQLHVVALVAALALSGCTTSNAARVEPLRVRASLPSDTRPTSSPLRSPGDEAPRAPLGELDLAAALATALDRDPGLRAATQRNALSEALARQAGKRPNPTFGLDLEDFAGSGDRAGYSGAQTTLWLSQRLERGGKRDARTRLAEIGVELSRLETRLRVLDVEDRTRAAFWRALAAQQELELAQTALGTAEGVHAAVVERVAAGRASPVEEAKDAVALTTARLDLAEARRRSDTLRRDLASCWAGTPRFDRLAGELAETRPPPDLETLLARLEGGPRARLLELRVRQQQAEVETQRAATRADVTVSAGLRRFEDTDDTAGVLGLQLPLRLFDSGADALAAADHGHLAAEHEAQAGRAELVTRVDQARARLQGAHEDAQALADAVLDEADWVLEAVEEGYREGVFELLDVLDAQRSVLDVRRRQLRALTDYQLARSTLESLIGEALP